MTDTADTPDLNDPDPAEEGEALAQLGRELDLNLDLTADEQVEFDRNLERLKQLGYGDVAVDAPGDDDDEEEDDEEEEEEEEGSEGGETDETTAPPPPVAQPAPTSFEVAGRQVPTTELTSLVQLQDYLNANPAVAAEFRELVNRQTRGEPLTPPPPEPKEEPLPEWVDADEPAAVAMWREHQALRAEVQTIRRASEESQRQAAAATQRAAALDAISSWERAHPELDSDAIEKVRTELATLRIVPGLVEQYGIEQGMAKALDLAYYSMPEFRPSQPDPAPANAERKRKISSVTGSRSGSIRRQPPKPSTYEDMRQQAAKFISENDLG